MTTTTVELQIIPLPDCPRCVRKVKRTLRVFDGVKLLHFNSENGKFTIETTKHPEEIRDALQRKFSGKSVILSNRINHSDPLSGLINPRNSAIEGPLNLRDIAEALATVSRANGLRTVEITQSSTINITFGNQRTTSESATNVLPVAQYQPRTSESVRRSENVWGSEDGGYGYVNRPPQPREYPYQPSTSGSGWADENMWGYGGGRNEDFGYGYVPPRTTSEPSDPLFPRALAQGYPYGYGYPIEIIRDDDCLCCCCTIL